MSAALLDTLKCPISGCIMGDPVILTTSGVSYERSALENWIELHGTDPSSGETLPSTARLIQNTCMRGLIHSILQHGAKTILKNAGGPVEDAEVDNDVEDMTKDFDFSNVGF